MSRAPLPSLRSLFASGGGPLAFVRQDEQLTERLARIARDEVPAIVEQGVRAAQVLTSVPDIAGFIQSIDPHADESSDPKHDERTAPPRRTARSSHAEDRAARRGASVSSSHGDEQSQKKKGVLSPFDPGFIDAVKAAVPKSKEEAASRKDKDAERTADLVRDVIGTIARASGALQKPPVARRKPDAIKAARGVAGEVATTAKGVARILGEAGKTISPSRAGKEGEREAARDRAKSRGAAGESLGMLQALQSMIRRLEHRGMKQYDAKTHKVLQTRETATEEYHREGRGTGGATHASAPRTATRAPSAHGSEYHAASLPEMSEPMAPTGGFRGLARWAAEQGGSGEQSSAIDRTDGERAPMLQQLHATRRSWTLDGDALSWSLDDAARNEGVDLDEVAS